MASPGNQHCATFVHYYNCVQCKRMLCFVDAVTRTDLTRISTVADRPARRIVLLTQLDDQCDKLAVDCHRYGA